MILALYWFQNILSIFLFDRRFRFLFAFVLLLLFLILLVIKKDGYDIVIYTTNARSMWAEPIFNFLLSFFANVFDSNRYAVFLIQLFFVLLFAILVRRVGLSVLFFMVGPMLVFFNLSLHNALRQGIASIFILLSIIELLDRKKVLCLIYVTFAILFHYSSIIFSLIIIFLYILNKVVYSSIVKYLIIIIFFSVSFIFLLYFLSYIPYYNYYFDYVITLNRTSYIFKIMPVLCSYFLIITYFNLKNFIFNHHFRFCNLLRGSLIIILLLLTSKPSFSEMGSRILFFYFSVELLFILFLIKSNHYRIVYFLILSYMFYINAINILTASG